MLLPHRKGKVPEPCPSKLPGSFSWMRISVTVVLLAVAISGCGSESRSGGGTTGSTEDSRPEMTSTATADGRGSACPLSADTVSAIVGRALPRETGSEIPPFWCFFGFAPPDELSQTRPTVWIGPRTARPADERDLVAFRKKLEAVAAVNQAVTVMPRRDWGRDAFAYTIPANKEFLAGAEAPDFTLFVTVPAASGLDKDADGVPIVARLVDAIQASE